MSGESSGASGIPGRALKALKSIRQRRQGSGDQGPEGFGFSPPSRSSTSRSNTNNATGAHRRSSHSSRPSSSHPEPESTQTTWHGTNLSEEPPAVISATMQPEPLSIDAVSSEMRPRHTVDISEERAESSQTVTHTTTEHTTSGSKTVTSTTLRTDSSYHAPANSRPQTPAPQGPVTPPSHPIDTPMSSPPPRTPAAPHHARTYTYTHTETRSSHLTETDIFIRHYIYKLGDPNLVQIPQITGLESYLGHIADVRLRRLPEPGSDWDRILHAAQLFGLQLWGLGCALNDPNLTDSISTRALTRTQTLLVLGLLKTRTLLPTFLVFQQLSVMLSHTSRAPGTTQARKPLERLYRSVVALVEAVAASLQDKLTSTSKEDITLDFASIFEDEMDNIWSSHRTVLVEMWLSEPSDRLELLHQRLRLYWSEREEFYGGVDASLARVGGTCEWLQHCLIDFLEGVQNSTEGIQKTLAITGGPGTGKSTLAHWIAEWLLVPLEGEEEMHVTLTYAFHFGSRVECTQLSFLRRILLQLFEKRIGDLGVYAKLERMFEEHIQRPDTRKLEAALWDALASGLKALDDEKIKTVIILDGVDRVTDEEGNQATDFFDKILDLTAKFHSTYLITLSEVNPLGGREVAISAASLDADIEMYYQHALSPLLSDEEKYPVANIFGTKTEMPFLWAHFMVQLLQFSLSQDATSEGILGTAKRIGGLSLDETLESLIPDALLKEETTRTILSFMLVARSPPTIVETSELLTVDIAKVGIKDTINVQHHVTSFCSDIVIIRNGVLHFKSSLVRSHVRARMGLGRSQPEEQKAHRKLAAALLLYAKVYLEPNDNSVPSFHALDNQAAGKLTSSFGLLRYALAYWQSHLHESGFDLSQPPDELRDVFPQSYRFALMQWTVWRDEHTANLTKKFVFFLGMQEACLGTATLYTLQTLIILALIHEQQTVHEHQAAAQYFNAANYYYRAACLVQRRSKADLRFFSAFVIRCAESYLDCIGRCCELDQDVMMRQQEMIRLLITVCSITYGHSSEYVMRWYVELAKLYITLQRFADAQALQEGYADLVGDLPDAKKHQKTLVGRIYSYVKGLNIEFATDLAPEAKSQYERFLIGVDGLLGTEFTRDVTFLLQVASSHEAVKAWDEAENTYISLWKRVTAEFDASQHPIQRQKDKLHVGLQYAQFLHKLRRDPEAADILILLWEKHERYSWHEESIVILFRKVGFFLKTLGRFEIADAVLTKIWEHGNIEKDLELELVIQQVTEEIIKKDHTQVTQVDRLESILKRRFEHKMIDEVFLGTSYTLAKRYIKLEEWEKAERVLTQALRATWEYILAPHGAHQGPPQMPTYDLFWSICLAVCLAELHDRMGKVDDDEASGIWLRASHVCRNPSSSINERKLLDVLVQFAHWQTFHQNILDAFLEIFMVFRNRLEPSDPVVIGILYDLAAYSERLGKRPDAYRYYIEIVTALNKGSDHCHKDACRAALKLIDHYHQKRLWVEHENVCKLLWRSFVHRDVTFTAKEVQSIYEGYISALERRRDDNAYSTMETISIEFRDIVRTIFAPDDFIVVFSGIAVAAVLENSERWIKAAYAYEEVIKTTQVSETTRTIIKESKQRLSAIYIKIFTSSELSTQVKAPTIHEAIKVCEEIYEQYRGEYGCWRSEALDQLKAVIILRHFVGQESDPKIVELLCKAFQDIVTTTTSACDPLSLYDAAKSLAFCFVQAHQEDIGLDLTFQGRHWSVFQREAQISSSARIAFTPDKPLNDGCYVFFASFERTISKRDLRGYAELMAAGRRETFLYNQYNAARKQDSAADRGHFVLVCGANLRLFWSEHHEHRIAKVFEDELLVFFKEEYSSFLIGSNDSPARTYLLALLVGLQGLDLHKEGANFAVVICQAGTTSVQSLLEGEQFQHALDVARCAFHFANKQNLYKDKRYVPYAFSLAELMAGVNTKKHPSDPLHTQYLNLSGEITATAMEMLSKIKIDIASLHLEDHRGIIRLLGYQKNYKALKSHLSILRKSHLATSEAPVSLSLSYLSIHADAADTAASSLVSAISTCRTLAHNLHQTRGPLDNLTLASQMTLSSLYAKQGSHLRSIEIHEGILRHIESTAGGSRLHIHWDRRRRRLPTQAPARPVDKGMLAKVAGHHLTLLMYAYARSGSGDWAQKKKELDGFHSRLQKCLGNDVKFPSGEVYESGKVSTGDHHPGLYVRLKDEEWVIDEKAPAGVNYVEAAGSIWGWVCEITRRGSVGL